MKYQAFSYMANKKKKKNEWIHSIDSTVYTPIQEPDRKSVNNASKVTQNISRL